ncbi:uncharacterized protein LOC135129379 [Zophobas morio]|uniref:uncharacterized protein LOC135129379 n=1 Tax=Zophobas morio TaxID=2755281 RepID=UPI0030830375
MGEEFRDCVKTFVDHLLRPENLVPKKIDGHFVKVKDLVTFISTYCKHINTETQLSVDTICMAYAEIFLQRRMDRTVEEYKKFLRSCENKTQIDAEKSKILKDLGMAREMKLATKELQESFKQKLTELLDAVCNDFLTLLNQEDDLRKEYIQYIKDCRTLKSAEEMKMTILVKFQKRTGNLNCDEELRKKSKQRLTGLIDKMYKNVHTLFDLMSQLIEEYTESVKECRTLEQAQTQIKNILEKFKKESENVNCNEDFRDNFKARLNAPLHQMCENFYTLFINVKKLEQEYNNSISNCNTLQHAEEAKNEILDKFEKNVNANSDCEEELRDIFKQRLTDNCEQIYKNNEADINKRELVDSALTAAKFVGGAMVAASHTCPPLAAAGSGLVALATLTASIIKKKREQ